MKATSFYALLLSLTLVSSIKINIVDEDYIEVLVGYPPKAMKLLIDPLAPFTYLLTTPSSSTVETYDNYEFSNIFGKFSGQWQSDTFYLTSDKSFGFRLKYLQVKETNSVFKADGVIGLGYSSTIDQQCSVYSLLENMKDVLKVKRHLSYDKNKKLLTVGELPPSDNFNPVVFPIFEGQNNIGPVVNLTAINFKSHNFYNKTVVPINSIAKLGLMPIIIAPKDSIQNLEQNYLDQIQTYDSQHELKYNEGKFYSDYFFTGSDKDITTEFVFDKIAYKFPHSEAKDGKFRSNIRLGDCKQNPLDFWYVGIDLLNVHRADFVYDDNGESSVKLYSPTAYDVSLTKYYLLWIFSFFSIVVCIILGVCLRCCCQKKRQKDIPRSQELLDI